MNVIRATETWQQAGAYYVRIQAMAKKHHITLRQEFDAHDTPETKYIVVTEDDFPIATARMYPLDKQSVMIGRVVVLPEYRHQGIGTRVVRECERWAAELGYAKTVLESRDNKVDFYLQMGYVTCGEMTDGDTFRCVRMEKELSAGEKKAMIETERLILREYAPDDFDALYEILSDPETMRHYPAPYDENKTRRWIEWNLENYAKYGFGLWAVTLRETGEFIGDCGLTMQLIDGESLPEIGYHINKKYWRRGYAKEAARAVRDWAFRNTGFDCLYSYMKYTNSASYSTALANGMHKVKEYADPKNEISYAYCITRGEWEQKYGK